MVRPRKYWFMNLSLTNGHVLSTFIHHSQLPLLVRVFWVSLLLGLRAIPWAIFFFYFHLSCLSNVLSFGRWLNMTEILWFRLLNPNIVVSYCRGRHPLVLVNCLEGLSLPRNSATINWSAQHDLIVDWAVKLQHKQTNTINVSVWVNFNMSAAKLCHLQLKVS